MGLTCLFKPICPKTWDFYNMSFWTNKTPASHEIKSNPYLPSGLFHPYILDRSICHFRGVWWNFSFLFIFFRNSFMQTV